MILVAILLTKDSTIPIVGFWKCEISNDDETNDAAKYTQTQTTTEEEADNEKECVGKQGRRKSKQARTKQSWKIDRSRKDSSPKPMPE